jgi:hypothetical protein
MDRATFERFCAFVAVFAQAFDASRAHHVIGTERFWELRLELTELAKRTDQALIEERGRERVLTAPHAQLLHECLNVAHVCMATDANLQALMPAVFGAATVDACYVMQQLDNYLLNKRIDAIGDRVHALVY